MKWSVGVSYRWDFIYQMNPCTCNWCHDKERTQSNEILAKFVTFWCRFLSPSNFTDVWCSHRSFSSHHLSGINIIMQSCISEQAHTRANDVTCGIVRPEQHILHLVLDQWLRLVITQPSLIAGLMRDAKTFALVKQNRGFGSIQFSKKNLVSVSVAKTVTAVEGRPLTLPVEAVLKKDSLVDFYREKQLC